MGAQVVVDPGDVEAEFADVFRLEAPDFQLDDDEARLGPVEEEEIDVEVVAADFEVVLTAREGEAVAELEQEAFQASHQRRFEFSLGDAAGQIEEVEDVGVADQLLGEIGVRCGQLVGEV